MDTDVKPLLSHSTTGELNSLPKYLRTLKKRRVDGGGLDRDHERAPARGAGPRATGTAEAAPGRRGGARGGPASPAASPAGVGGVARAGVP
eukprot:4563021-Pyramimonas_sp.AAC.2